MLTTIEMPYIPEFEDRVATRIVVPGRGLEGDLDDLANLHLTMGARQRVNRLHEYVTTPRNLAVFRTIGGTAIFSGSHPGDRMPEAPPRAFREGALMLEAAQYLDWPDHLLPPRAEEPQDDKPHLRLVGETNADTTLENMLRTRSMFGEQPFTPKIRLASLSMALTKKKAANAT